MKNLPSRTLWLVFQIFKNASFIIHHVILIIKHIQDLLLVFPNKKKSTYLCRTAISFSMLFSLPSKAFLGIHLIATNLWVLFSSARTTSENAPLKHKHTGQSVRPQSIYYRCSGRALYASVTQWREKKGFDVKPAKPL